MVTLPDPADSTPLSETDASTRLDQVALAFLRHAADTLAARLFLTILPRLGPHPAREVPRALALLAEALPIPAGQRSAQIDRARAQARSALAAADPHIRAITNFDADYPALLRQIPAPPLVLWVRGTLPSDAAVAVVGSRNATAEGLANARRLGRGLVEAGLVVVSGLARGIDGAAHRGALAGGGLTVAVLGSGADVLYPAGHASLAEQVAGHGAIVSEYPPGTPPLPWQFPLRNRIISGLSRAVVVVEAGAKSGSLITAKAALEQGRDVLAVPGGIASGCHQGCHGLIKDGARLVETVEDVLDEIGWERRQAVPPAGACPPKDDAGLARLMAPGDPVEVDQLAARTGRSTAELLAELASLEVRGVVARVPGGRFVRLD